MYSVYLLLGSNEGERLKYINEAAKQINQHAGSIDCYSKIYETEAWGKRGMPLHLNQALHLKTTLEPFVLLTEIQKIEFNLGRERHEKWGLRKIDIDIIYFDNFIIQRPLLQIPHPLMQQRRFVLEPLNEIAPDFRHPKFLKTNKALLASVNDPLGVTIFNVEASESNATIEN